MPPSCTTSRSRPIPATHSRCTLGGMIGNNSCGVHALMGGKTVDNVHALDVLLYDGTRMTVGKTSGGGAGADHRRRRPQGADLRRASKKFAIKYASLIRQKFPRIPRRVSGYNLDELLPENGFNVARALVGSEGTCVTVLEAELRLMASPPFRRLVCIGFPDAFIAADAVPGILTHKPIGLEGFDGTVVDALRAKGHAPGRAEAAAGRARHDPGGVRRLDGGGRRRAGGEFWPVARNADAAQRLSHLHRARKRRRCGTSASPRWARWRSSRGKSTDGKAGKTRRCRPIAWDPISGNSSR